MKRFPSSRCASTIQIVWPLELMAETQPQLQPAALSLSAMISQSRFTRRILPLLRSSRQQQSDSRVRRCWQRDRHARAHGRFQSLVNLCSHHGAPPAKTNFHDSTFTGRFARDASRIRRNNSIHISLDDCAHRWSYCASNRFHHKSP